MFKAFKTLIVAGVMLALSCTSWYVFFYRPQTSRLATLKQESERMLLTLQSFRVSDTQLKALEAQVDSLHQEIERTRQRLMPKHDLPLAIAQIRTLAGRFGLTLERVLPDYVTLLPAPDDPNAGGEILKLTVHLQMQGRYRDLGRFMESLRELPFFVSVGELTIAYNEAIHPRLNIMLDAVLFLRLGSKARAKS